MHGLNRVVWLTLLVLVGASLATAEASDNSAVVPTTAETREFLFRQDDREVKMTFVQIEGAWVSQRCAEAESCRALDILRGEHPAARFEEEVDGRPDALYCSHLGGYPLTDILTGMAFCLFKDNSLISSWPLYKRYRARRDMEFESRSAGGSR